MKWLVQTLSAVERKRAVNVGWRRINEESILFA